MRIYIPSTHRADMLDRGPLVDMNSGAMREFSITYVVPVGQAEEYTERLREQHDDAVAVMSCPAHGIAGTRFWIGQHAASAGVDKFLMLDDDIRFLVRKQEDDWRLRGTTPLEVEELLWEVDNWLTSHDHVGVSAREGNNRIGVGGPQLRADNTRTLRALGYRTDSFLSVEHGRVEVMEDFDVNLQILRRGGSNTSLHYWAQGQDRTNAPGGCSTYRTHEVHERSAHRLAELHPGHVKLRQKTNKTDAEGFGTRTEVTIQWKKAHKEGQAL